MDPQDESDEDKAMSVGFDPDGGAASEVSEPAGQQPQDAPPAGQQDGAVQADAGGQGPSSEPVEDPFSGLPPQVRELLAKVPALEGRLEEEKAARIRAEGQFRAVQGRVDRLTQSVPAPAPVSRTPKLDHALEALGTDMPEVTDALGELKSLLPAFEPTPQPEPTPAAAPAPQAQADEIDPVAAAHLDALTSVREDWFETLDSADCKLWLERNPEMKAKYAHMRTAKDALDVLAGYDKYREGLQQAASTAAARSARMAAAAIPTGSRRAAADRTPPLSEEEAMARAFST
jgi:hypothetical protein